jgi:hypothetical protein
LRVVSRRSAAAAACWAALSSLMERLREILQKIVWMLEADRNAKKPL